MVNFPCVYYRTRKDDIPVKEFIDSLPESDQEKFFQIKVNYLEDMGPLLGRPYAEHVKGKIIALRFKGVRGQIRIFYFFNPERKSVLTHGYIKTEDKIDPEQIKRAERFRKEYFQRLRKGV